MDQCMAVELVEDLKVRREDLRKVAGIIITILDLFFFLFLSSTRCEFGWERATTNSSSLRDISKLYTPYYSVQA